MSPKGREFPAFGIGRVKEPFPSPNPRRLEATVYPLLSADRLNVGTLYATKINGGAIDIPGQGQVGFHVDASGNVTAGAAFADSSAEFYLTAGGALTLTGQTGLPALKLRVGAAGVGAYGFHFFDGSTELARLSEIGSSGHLKLSGAADGASYYVYEAMTDSVPRLQLTASELFWGPGGASNFDVSLGRSAAGILKVGTSVSGVTLDVAWAIRLSGALSPSQITADQNNYNPTGFSSSTVLRLSTDASRTLTGLATGADGRVVLILNVGSNDLVLSNLDAGSSAANQFSFGASITLNAAEGVTLWYDSTSSLWRCIGRSN